MAGKVINFVKFEMKKGGKNKSDVDGFYYNQKNEAFFIKQPKDLNELFTELFAGFLLTEFKQRGLIPKVYHSTLICADYIKLSDGSYALIQPKINFTELFKIIGTGNNDNSERNLWKEIWDGANYYKNLTKQNGGFGLPVALLYSLLLGAYSVHSGNVVVLKGGKKKSARLDWGDAFRNFGVNENNHDILYPYEYKGFLNIKTITKSYIHYYRKIPGLFSVISEKADELNKTLTPELLLDIISTSLKKIPVDLIDDKTKADLADYMCIPEFKDINFSDPQKIDKVARKFSQIFSMRLKKLTQLTESKLVKTNPSPRFYNKKIYTDKLITNLEENFNNQLKRWENLINQDNLDFSDVNIEDLINQYNGYVKVIADMTNTLSLWTESTDGCNLLNPCANLIPNKSDELGEAFLPFYRESILIKRLFIDSTGLSSSNYDEISDYFGQKHSDHSWTKISNSLKSAKAIVRCITELKEAYSLEKITTLRHLLIEYRRYHDEIDKLFTQSQTIKISSKDELIFHSLPLDALFNLSGNQLFTLCNEELSSNHFTIIEQIISDDNLWLSLTNAFNESRNASKFISSMKVLQELRTFHVVYKELSETFETHKIGLLFDKLKESSKKLPPIIHERFQEKIELIERKYYLHNVLEKAAGTPLKEALIQRICNQNSNTNDDLTNNYELRYLTSLNNFIITPGIKEKLIAFRELETVYRSIPNPTNSTRQSFDFQKSKSIIYENLINIEEINDNEAIKKIDLILDFIHKNKKFSHYSPEKLLEDKLLWSTIFMTNRKQISPITIHDCLTIKEFYDKNQLKLKNHKTYQNSLTRVYENSLKIRFSNLPIIEQINSIKKMAHVEFKHRHFIQRAILDIFLLGTVLGIGVGIGRVSIYNKSFFFSNSKTKREKDFQKQIQETALSQPNLTVMH